MATPRTVVDLIKLMQEIQQEYGDEVEVVMDERDGLMDWDGEHEMVLGAAGPYVVL